MNKKKALAESIAIQKIRLDQVNEKLKDQNLSNEQKGTLESEKRIASEEILKLETTK
ncbi:hypothetical protein [Candidatus Nitrosotalea sp. FS]|uniref:hypothetical protein n=1 Tax=Candidatus Nitrosotalea sp. FS TaxID=2341021 RepID=UPI00140CED73|nr:hypothetical protein [Candidatus Nitrosotalea sp. FS]